MNRAHRSMWVLTALALLAVGLVSQSLTASAGPVSDGLLAGSLLLLVITGTLLVRVLRYLSATPNPPAPAVHTPPRTDSDPHRTRQPICDHGRAEPMTGRRRAAVDRAIRR